MNRSYEEYEEVESPFASNQSPAASTARDRLRTRRNVFNRPFATDPSAPPAVFDTQTRKSIGNINHTELLEHRPSELEDAEIEYLDEEDDEVEVVKKAPRSTSAKKNNKAKKVLLTKIGWSVIGLLVLRLIFMDRGVWDYFATESTIQDKKQEFRSIQKENNELKSEITRIQVDSGFQRQLAKEHLGVIAAEEFLILFAGESMEPKESTSRDI